MDFDDKNKSSSVVPTRWNQDFAERLTKRRKNLRFEQQELADKSGVKLRTIQNYEAGGSPTAKFIILLANALRCSTGWLLMGEGPEPGPPGQKTEHDKPTPIYKVEDRPDRVAAPEEQYDLHGGWKPRPEMQDQDHNMLGKAFEIIRSNTIYRAALMANINAFHAALAGEQKLDKALKMIQDLENRLEVLEKSKPPPKKAGNSGK